MVSGWQAAEDYNIVPSQRFLDHDDGDEDDVGHDAHPAQAGQDHRGDLVRLNTNTLKCGDTLYSGREGGFFALHSPTSYALHISIFISCVHIFSGRQFS